MKTKLNFTPITYIGVILDNGETKIIACRKSNLLIHAGEIADRKFGDKWVWLSTI